MSAARKTGLGKGLDALIPTTPQTQQGLTPSQLPASSIDSLLVDQIVPNPRQPRTIFATKHLTELAASIKEHGVIQPLIVMQGETDEQYILIAGERRLQAAKLAELETVPVVIREKTSDQGLLELALIENVQRADLNPLETAAAYQALTKEFGLTQDQVAERVGMSRVSITNKMSLLSVSERLQAAILNSLDTDDEDESKNFKVTEGHARALKGLSHAQQNEALRVVISQELSVRKTEELARKYKGQQEKIELPPSSKTPEILDLENRLFEKFTTKVNIAHSEKGGRITLHYTSDEEMNALLMKLLGEL